MLDKCSNLTWFIDYIIYLHYITLHYITFTLHFDTTIPPTTVGSFKKCCAEDKSSEVSWDGTQINMYVPGAPNRYCGGTPYETFILQ